MSGSKKRPSVGMLVNAINVGDVEAALALVRRGVSIFGLVVNRRYNCAPMRAALERHDGDALLRAMIDARGYGDGVLLMAGGFVDEARRERIVRAALPHTTETGRGVAVWASVNFGHLDRVRLIVEAGVSAEALGEALRGAERKVWGLWEEEKRKAIIALIEKALRVASDKHALAEVAGVVPTTPARRFM